MNSRLGQLIARRDLGELTPDEQEELNGLLAGIIARRGSLHWDYPFDIEEAANAIGPTAAYLVTELDPVLLEYGKAPAEYIADRNYTALNTLVSIALLPTTEDDR